MFATPAFLNLHYHLRDSNYEPTDVRPPYAVEGRSRTEVTHLALLGVKKQGTAFREFLFLSQKLADK